MTTPFPDVLRRGGIRPVKNPLRRRRPGGGLPPAAGRYPRHLAGAPSYIAAHKLELIKAASKAAMTTEYIIYRLCGEWATDPSTAPSYLCDLRRLNGCRRCMNGSGCVKSSFRDRLY